MDRYPHQDELIERWWTPSGRALAVEVFAFLCGERPLPDGLALHEGMVDLRGIGVPPPPTDEAAYSLWLGGRPPVDYGPVGGPFFVVQGCRWERLDLSGSWLRRLDASGLQMSECRFDDANLRGWRLRGCEVTECSFASADLTSSWLMVSETGASTTFAATVFDGARMSDLDLHGGRFHGCTFERTRLDRTRFQQVELRNCVFSGPLRDVTFDVRSGPNGEPARPMRAVDFGRATFERVVIRWQGLQQVTLPPGVILNPDGESR